MKSFDRLPTSLICALLLAGCSANSAWNPDQIDGANCSKDKCDDGYSCVVTKCVRHNSLGYKETCLDNISCKDGLVCPPRVFACRKECSNYYSSDSACNESNVFCAPLYTSDGTKFLNTGACLDAQCTAKKADAKAGDTVCEKGDCVLFKTRVGSCFKECTYTIGEDGAYNDNLETQGKTCHPVGSGDNQTLVEWPSGTKLQGEPCDQYSAPCAKGLVCIKGTGISKSCHKLCSINGAQHLGCEADQQCSQAKGYSFCSSVSGDSSTDR